MKRLWLISILFFVFACEEEDKDETPPTVMITNIQAGSELSGVVDVIVDANDNDAIALVEFFIDGQLKGTSQSQEAIHTFKWDTDARVNGTYQIYAKATDESENVATSNLLTVKVLNYRLVSMKNTVYVSVFYKINNEGDWIKIESGDTSNFEVPKNSTVNFTGTTPTNYCGTILEWDFNIDVEDSDVMWKIWVTDKWFLLMTKNSSDEIIDWQRINEGLIGDTYCVDDTPNDGQYYYFDGFYHAHPNSNIYWSGKENRSWYIDGVNEKIDYRVIDDSYLDRNLFAKFHVTNSSVSSASDELSTEYNDDGYMRIPSSYESSVIQGGYGRIGN